MALNKDAINKFQSVYKTTYGEDISYEEAEKQANDLIDFLWSLANKNKNSNKDIYVSKETQNKKAK